ncbi:hypothetical protein GW17_00058150 [Ensete ventricosum]|nr:hypothetical protein GW17_00058150 [Ensete ventricosum]
MEIMYTRIVLKISRIHRGRIILFSKGCLEPLFPPLRHHRCPCPGGDCPCPLAATLPRGGNPYGWRRRPCWPRAAAPGGRPVVDPLCGHRAASGCRPYGLAAVGRAHGRLLPPRAALLPAGAAPTGWPQPVVPTSGCCPRGRSLRKRSKNMSNDST